MNIPKGKEKNRLYTPIGLEVVKESSKEFKKLLKIEQDKLKKGVIKKIDYEELRKKINNK